MSDIGPIDKMVGNLQETLVFLKEEIAKAQAAIKKALDSERQADEAISWANQKVAECVQKEVHFQRQQEDLTIRENKIRRYEDFEAQLITLDRDRAALSNERVAFNAEVRRRREELNAKAEEILQARQRLEQREKQLEQDRRTMRQEVIQSILNKEL